MIDRPGVRTGEYVAQRDQQVGVDLDSKLFSNLALSGDSKARIVVVAAAARENKSVWIIAKVFGSPIEVNLDASLTVTHKCDGGGWDRVFSLEHAVSRSYRGTSMPAITSSRT
jgi:hypothetical protein